MNKPIVKSGELLAGKDFVCGENVVVDVDEYVVVGDRVTLGDNTYLCGRYIEIGSDFYGYSHWGKRLEIGLGREGNPDAILEIGDRCTFHDNKIDLAKPVFVGDDVGLSPEVAIYTHGYWQSPFAGNPLKRKEVTIGNRNWIGFRSTILPGVETKEGITVGAGSVVTWRLEQKNGIYVGAPAKLISLAKEQSPEAKKRIFASVVMSYQKSLQYRNIKSPVADDYPIIFFAHASFHLENLIMEGTENDLTDDFRWFLFSHGFRIYTQRRFKQLGIQQ